MTQDTSGKYKVNDMAADDLAMSGARPSISMSMA